jgi:FtsP/CotA-like multicopper oxidase with cupredoxin domain
MSVRSRRSVRWIAAPALAAVGTAAALTHFTGRAAEHPAAGRRAADNVANRTRSYFIQSEEVRWNYAPAGHDRVTGRPFGEAAKVFVRPAPDRIGSTYTKCLYRGYQDASFRERLPRPPEEAHLGLLGPVMRAEVGDTIRVVFRNTCRFPATLHPHGVFYAKDSEGTPYDDGTAGADKKDDAVPRGSTVTHVWQVPERAGPDEMDVSSVQWMYHSHTDEVIDTNSGLMGPIVVTRRGMARPDGRPRDVDRELFALFTVVDENTTHYIAEQTARLPRPPDPDEHEALEAFEESNLMHSVNGFVYGNWPDPRVRRGDRVRWYTMSMGTEVDLHTPHWHGNTVTVAGMRMDTVSLLPAEMATADMRPDAAGTWLFHCHVNDHITAGMQARYVVTR